MSIANKYITPDEYDRDWEPKYQTLEKKYFNEEGEAIGDTTEYNNDTEKLDYYYAKTVAQKISKKMIEINEACKSALERNDYTDYERQFNLLNETWSDFNSPFHYKMTARGILERD